jgi:hypothetical protein
VRNPRTAPRPLTTNRRSSPRHNPGQERQNGTAPADYEPAFLTAP